MSNPEKLFIVVDPTDLRHVALERAVMTAKLHDVAPVFKIFVAVDAEAVDTRAANTRLYRNQKWFGEEIKTLVEEAGIEYIIEVSWSTEWQQSIVTSAKEFGADRIYLPVHERTEKFRFSFSESKWDLLKTAHCPVVLIQPAAPEARKVILAAVNFQVRDDEQQALNQSIFNWGKEVSAIYNADFHIVNAYRDSMMYPDRGQLANETGLPAEKIHVESGYTDEAVSTVAKRLNADLVIMGTLGQNGLIRSRRGNTAARVIAALEQDIMVVNH